MKTFDEALDYLIQQAKPTNQTLSISVGQACGYILAEDIISGVNVPSFDNSQMDGYAIRCQDLNAQDTFSVSQRIPAGSLASALQPNSIARIFTGAPMPEGADTIVMQEDTEELENGEIKILLKSARLGDNVRVIGEDIAIGQTLFSAGRRLTAQDLGLIASIGIAEVNVYRPLRIATFTTGDELLEPGDTPQPGKIFNANRYTLSGAIPQLGFELIDLSKVEDTLEATIEAMKAAASQADVVMTTGGVSVGEEDHIKPAIESLGALDMWKVKMKPGKPLAFGNIGGTPFIGLPGNPVSAFATFYLFARPFLLAMQGMKDVIPTPLWLTAGFEWNKPHFRRDFARARMVQDNTRKETYLELFPKQGSNVLTSTAWADGFAVIPEDTTIAKGDKVAFFPFNDLT
ncbi:molybdenum cofactor biosynthesis protein MoaA [Hydrogenovibrio marinus]|uniref:Molybdopterin molybdenumtransferase n=2 Tax=Hydrogenovibrio marinus TaxID=28885 RepID=A0A067A012_HYDMR|nr:molybdenum cofactor biosynthesis protein MoaA [Hydrogenovibrio marinus]BBN58551.1 molybdopterin molybdenumtransferase MoeA [Hydrogenovibrio marinus]